MQSPTNKSHLNPPTSPNVNPSHLAPHTKPQPFNVGSSIGIFPPVHLVFVHGWRGDWTSFRRFPSDVHYKLDDRIPSLQTHIYPTYKSRKPLQFAVETLKSWMRTLEEGMIILIGHSLGGFVVADAALQWDSTRERNKVIGFIAMDVPYLGVHPHVIVSGIESLLPSCNEDQPDDEEADMNDLDKVNMVKLSDIGISDSDSKNPSRSDSPTSIRTDIAIASNVPALQEPDLTPGPTAWEATKYFFTKHKRDPLQASFNWLVSHWEHGSMLLDPDGLRNRYHSMEAWDGEWVNFYTETVPNAKRPSRTPSPSLSPSIQGMARTWWPDTVRFPVPVPVPNQCDAAIPSTPPRSDDTPSNPWSSFSKEQAQPDDILHFPEPEPFMSFQLDGRSVSPAPSDRSGTDSDKDRPRAERTSTDISVGGSAPTSNAPTFLKPEVHRTTSTTSSTSLGSTSSINSTSKDSNSNKLQKLTPEQREEKRRANASPHRFIILPRKKGDRSRWERVPVAGVPHEVAAHVGLFFPDKNWDYDEFVDRVRDWVVGTCVKRGKEALGY